MQQVRVVQDRDGNVLVGEESLMGKWKEYFEDWEETRAPAENITI